MSTNNNWIKMSEIKPRLADLPIWVWEKERTGPTVYTNILPGSGWSHWKPAAADIPAPPREKTQRDKDAEAYGSRYHGTWLVGQLQGGHWTSDIWHAALAHERAEVGKLLAPLYEPNLDAEKVLLAIRARCGGGK